MKEFFFCKRINISKRKLKKKIKKKKILFFVYSLAFHSIDTDNLKLYLLIYHKDHDNSIIFTYIWHKLTTIK